MKPELQALESCLSNNQLSGYYAKQLISSLDATAEEELATILRNIFDRYSDVP